MTGKLREVMRSCCFPRTVVWQVFLKKDVSREGNKMDLWRHYQDKVWKKWQKCLLINLERKWPALPENVHSSEYKSFDTQTDDQTTLDDLGKGKDHPSDSNAHDVECIQVSLARPSQQRAFVNKPLSSPSQHSVYGSHSDPKRCHVIGRETGLSGHMWPQPLLVAW